MPELPDITVYLEALERRIVGHALERVKLASPFILRSFDPPLEAVNGRVVRGLRRIGKRIVLDLGEELFVVLHLMIAGRLHWRAPGEKRRPQGIVASFELAGGTLHFTEAGTRKRASITVVRGEEALRAIDPGGIEPLASTFEEFDARLRSESHTLKRALTDPRLFSGIGNAYSDEILHAARLSPLKLTRSLTEDEARRLHQAVRVTLASWTDILRAEAAVKFPEKVTAFREGMAVHGRYREPCPVCGSPVQRIVYAENECNYCATCQTGGKLLADRSLSRLLKDDWPKTIDNT
ncbi:MAG TPA: DNA-formamidopyrimidine glycosylase family protein [Usitatibacter sp.]|jgi:formamidopyrimidine-DNA glycosylase|nr:DNA-formamidopyrimidine glycosylase family protein [Usitatibacter sp.]